MRRNPRPSRRGMVIALVVAAVLITAGAASHVWSRLKVIEYGYQISKASRRQTELLEVNRRLRIEVALLKNPDRVARIAAQELGMQHPQPEQIRRLRLGSKPDGEHLARAR